MKLYIHPERNCDASASHLRNTEYLHDFFQLYWKQKDQLKIEIFIW